MKHILRLILLLGSVLLITSGAVVAQKTIATFCGDLTKADCTFLTDAEAVSTKLDSRSFKMDIAIDVNGISDMPGNKLHIHLSGSGAIIVDQKALPDTSKLDTTNLAKDPKAMLNLFGGALSAITADLKFTLDIPKELKPMMGSSKLPDELNLNVKLVDGVVYINTAELAPFLPKTGRLPNWMGVNLTELLTTMMKQPEFATGLNSMSSGMSAGMSASFSSMFSDPKNLATFINVKRLADSSLDKHKVAVFETIIDYPALFALPGMQDMLKQQMTASGSKLSDSEAKAAMAMIMGLAKNMKFSMTRSFDLENKYLYETKASMNFDFSSMKAQMGSAMTFGFEMTVSQSDFNAVPAISAPKGAMVLPTEAIISSK